nr:PREDICTED: uncharacterized protein LOC109030132 [Bemisia tabaci]
MKVLEADRPSVGGDWCGTSWAPAHYFSETDTLKVIVRLLRLSKNQTGYNFDFRLTYKMLPTHEAVVRYGGSYTTNEVLQSQNDSTDTELLVEPSPPEPYYLGDLISGTYCSRIFNDCNTKNCRLQSPNWPGLYPRNLTCYYAVRQHDVPPGKHALIVVRQPRGQLVSIRSQSDLYARNTNNHKKLKVWSECDDVQDYVTVYDGYTTRDPVLLKFCGEGSVVPEAVSSGPELLVEFSTSPYGTLLYPPPQQPLHGFQLQVQVHFVEQESSKYTRNKRCEFWIRGSGKGVLESPRHSLSPNTTCLYHLIGEDTGSLPPRYQELMPRRHRVSRFKVWLSVLKFHLTSPGPHPTTHATQQPLVDCSARLQIWDGNVQSSPSCNDIFCDKELSHGAIVYAGGQNLTLLARYCKDSIPRSCDHSILRNHSRPCSRAESFLSSADTLTLDFKVAESTSLRPVSFRALYEFVDLHQDGDPWGSGPCSRRFQSKTQQLQPQQPHKFRSPRNVFLFGRGGATNLSCVFRFEGQKGEKVRITLLQVATGNRSDCATRLNPDSGHLQCIGGASATVRLSEHPFAHSPPLPRDCLCSGADAHLPLVFESSSHVVHVELRADRMSAGDDYRGIHFEGTYEFLRPPVCTRPHRFLGSSGQIHFQAPHRTPEEVNCEKQPILLEAKRDKHLFIKMTGMVLPGSDQVEPVNRSLAECDTKNRIVIHSGPQLHTLVCPDPPSHETVEVFSQGWVISNQLHQNPEHWIKHSEQNTSSSVVLEFISKESGSYHVSWLEIARRKPSSPLAEKDQLISECLHRCPEIDACINSSLWCDGVDHCPSGYDESLTHCFYLFKLPALYLLIIGVGVLLCCCFVCILHAFVAKNSESKLKSLPSDTEAIMNHKELIS